MNKVTLTGKIGREPEVRTTTSGLAVANFSIGTKKPYRKDADNSKRDWHNVVFFGTKADVISKYVHKGDLLLVEGRLDNEEWTDQQGQKHRITKVVGDEFEFLTPKPSAGIQAPEQSGPVKDLYSVATQKNDESLPF